jgi:hypothetical protein
MGYYIRVLGTQDPDIHIDELIDSLTSNGLNARIEYNPSEQPNKWSVLDIVNDKGEPLAQIERNLVVDGELGHEELEEFKEMVQDCKPTSAAKWLTKYFDKVKVIYAFQILNAGFDNSNFEIISSIKAKIWDKTGGILQADNEGFSNEDGYHILWQFSDDVTGDWSCAIRNWMGQWEKFTMDLDDKTQRQEFQSGKVPKNATRI